MKMKREPKVVVSVEDDAEDDAMNVDADVESENEEIFIHVTRDVEEECHSRQPDLHDVQHDHMYCSPNLKEIPPEQSGQCSCSFVCGNCKQQHEELQLEVEKLQQEKMALLEILSI